MSEQELVKVYELAKELGIDSISLLDKLKNLNIKVKNHMSELREEEVQLARTSLKKGGDGGKSSVKSSSRTRRKGAETSMGAHLGSTDTLNAEKKAASPIIRRRIKGDSTIETPIHPPSQTGSSEGSARVSASSSTSNGLAHRTPSDASEMDSHGSSYSQESLQSGQTDVNSGMQDGEVQNDQLAGANSHSQAFESKATETSVAQTAAGEALRSVEKNEPDQSSQEQKSSFTSEKTPVLKISSNLETRLQQTPQKAKTTESSLTSTSSTPTASSSSMTQTHPSSSGARTSVTSTPSNTASSSSPGKTAGKPPRPPIVLTPRPVAPRRSILKIVEATPPPPRPIIKPAPQPASTPQSKSSVKGTATQDKEGYRIIKMTKENLDQMVEEEAAKKRGSGRDVELRPEDVRFADYRKKELVFLPKKKKIPVGKEIRKTQKTVAKAQKRVVEIQESISVQDLANQLSVKANDVLRKLIGMGQMATINQTLDFDTASLIANEYQYEARNVAFDESVLLPEEKDEPEKLKPRPPVVTIMGHVDHGKTTLLDSIREANVAGGEAGGITQHIGAYTVEKNGKLISFIDTPGHEAFTVMRARGANVTDIVILVVSADDGVMPQTREAISHAQAAKVPIIVAVNKIDKPGANPEKIKQTLAELNLLAEDWGGDTQFVPVSALKRINLDKLLDAILLQAEILDLKANPSTRASGTILEARLEKGRGPVMSVLIRKGTLRIGDPIVAGNFAGKVKALSDDKGKIVKSAGPGFAVEILGLEGVPNAGEVFNATDSDAIAKDIAQHRQDQLRAKVSGTQSKVSLEQLFSKIQAGDVKELNVILKADAFGSVEAIRESLVKLSTDKVKVKPILTAAGGITESDVLLASASNAIIIGFNVRPETKARQLAESEHVEVKSYNIIYQLLDEVKLAMTGLLEKRKVEKFLGRAEVRQIFTVPKIGTVAGSSVIDGKIARGANVRLLRDSRVLYEGKMSSLRRFKDDVKEVATGFECGIGIESYNDLKPGDIIEAFQIELVTPELSE